MLPEEDEEEERETKLQEDSPIQVYNKAEARYQIDSNSAKNLPGERAQRHSTEFLFNLKLRRHGRSKTPRRGSPHRHPMDHDGQGGEPILQSDR